MKAFDMPVLCGLSRLNVNGTDASLYTPGQIVPTAHLGPVIGAKKLRCAALRNDLLQYSCHAAARHARIGFQRQAFASKGVHHAEHAQPLPARGDVAGKINCPFLVRCRERLPLDVTAGQSLAPDAPNAKSSGTIYPLHSFVVNALACASQQNVKSSVPETWLLVRQLD